MPVTYTIDKTHNIILTRCVGQVTLDEVIAHFKTLREDPDCPPKLNVLLDLSESATVPEGIHMEPMSESIAAIRDRVKFDACAIVVHGELMFGMARIFLVAAEDSFRSAQVFRSVDDAKAWLRGGKGMK